MEQERGAALVTGASSGIGRETALRLAEKGYRVIAAARRLDRLQELADKVGGIVPRRVDLAAPEDVDAFCQYIRGLDEPVAVLVNNAGYSIRGALEDVPMDAARRLYQVNVFSLMQVTQACLPGMRAARTGTIVNLSSMAGKFAFPLSGVYASTKYAVEAVTDSLRIELRPFGIRVIAIRPGFIATEFNETGNKMTGDLMARTDPEYKPLYQASGEALGKLFVNATVPGPQLIADIIVNAALSDAPKPVYSAGFMSEELLGPRAELDDENFDRFLSRKTGLLDVTV